MTDAIELSRREISDVVAEVEKNIHGYSHELSAKIQNAFRKDDPVGIYAAVKSFFVAQKALHNKLKKSMSSTEAMLFSTYVASKYGAEKLAYHGTDNYSGFDSKQVNFSTKYHDLLESLVEIYSDSIEDNGLIKLEAKTQAFFDWTMKTSLTTIEKRFNGIYERISASEVKINGNVIKLDLKEHKTSAKHDDGIPEIDMAMFEVGNDYEEKIINAGPEEVIDVAPYVIGDDSAKKGGKGIVVVRDNQEIQKLIKSMEGFKKEDIVDVNFIHGHDSVVQDLEERAFVYSYIDLFGQFIERQDLSRNSILEGPPGTGKTSIAKSIFSMPELYVVCIPAAAIGSSFHNQSHRRTGD